MDIYNLKAINSLALEPEDKDDFDNWTSQEGVVKYLEDESKDEYIIIYASLPHTFIHGGFQDSCRLKLKIMLPCPSLFQCFVSPD